MIVDYELIAGVKLGIEADEMYVVVDEETDMPDFNQPPCPVIYLHLGIVTFMFLFD